MTEQTVASSKKAADQVQRLKRNAVGTVGVIFMAVATAAPITAMVGNVPIAVGFGNGSHAPAGYIVATVVLGLFAIGYATMAKHITATGAFYGYISHGLGRIVGMASGLLITMGNVGDRVGRRRLLLYGAAGFSAASVAAAFAPTAPALILARAGLGVAGATLMPSTLSLIRNIFMDERRRQFAVAVWATMFSVGAVVGPIIGGLLLEHFWWGSVFLVGVPVALLGIVAVVAFVPESKDPSPGRLDIPGVLLSIGALAGLVYGIIRGGSGKGWTTPGVLVPLLGGLALLVIFVWIQRRSSHPALDVSLFRNPAFSAAAVALGLNFFALLGATFYLVFYLQGVRGYSPLQSGASLIPVAVAWA